MVFLDYASTCPIVKFSSQQYDGFYCNPNAAYAYAERKMLMECEERIKAAIGVKSGHVLYFRCATEAIDWLYRATIEQADYIWWRRSPYEHDACQFGYEAKVNHISDAIDFYIHQWVNHITGEIFSLKTIRSQLPETCKFIVDATAGFGKAKLPSGLDDIADALFMSGYKIGCPELSFMWLNDDLCEWLGAAKDIRNQWGLHHGSLSVASAMALTDAVEWACENGDRVDGHSVGLYVQINNLLDEACIEHHDIIGRQAFAASINAIRLNGINADALQQFLATRGIYIGVGSSACSAAHDYRVLRAYGLTDDEATEVIRVSFGPETTADDVDALVNGIVEYRRQFC
nr:MAG TPA: cysteine sulfinate desulfinase/cysteine desulfurase [Caudoviricetes sp.]